MFTILDFPVITLFDTGASVSVLSATFADKTSLTSSLAETTDITLPSGEIIATSTCYTDVPLIIAGTTFPSTFLEFPLRGIDVILGMDWLSKFDARLQCRDQRVYLKDPKGKKVIYKGMTTQKGIKLISAMRLVNLHRKGNQIFLCSVTITKSSLPKLEEVQVVNEYVDVFPEELPGIPPERDVEFTIELMPGAGPIAKAPYRSRVGY
jgi:hypothetical protein